MKCIVLGCKSKPKKGTNVTFYRFPMYRRNNTATLKRVILVRRKAWLKAVNRQDLTSENIRLKRICSKHFISGKRAECFDIQNPDWVPTLHLDPKESSQNLSFVHMLDQIKKDNLNIDNSTNAAPLFCAVDIGWSKRAKIKLTYVKENPGDTLDVPTNTKPTDLEQQQTIDDPCSVNHCQSSTLPYFVDYFELPKLDPRESCIIGQLINEKRRAAWLEMIPFKKPYGPDMVKICSEHFVFGEPANTFNYCHVDWVPSLHLTKDEPNIKLALDDPLDPCVSFDHLDNNLKKNVDFERQFKSFREDVGEWIFGKTKYKMKKEKIKTKSSDIIKEATASHVNKAEETANHVNKAEEKVNHVNKAEEEMNHVNKAEEEVNHVNKAEEEVNHVNKAEDKVNHVNKAEDKVNHVNKAEDKVNHVIKAEERVNQVNKAEERVNQVNKAAHHQLRFETISNLELTEFGTERSKPVITTFLCGCGLVCPTTKDLSNHILKFCKLLKCYICHQEFLNRVNFHTHFQNHLTIRRFTCEFCYFPQTMSAVDQLKHIHTKHPSDEVENYYICDICGQVYFTANELEYHVDKKHLQFDNFQNTETEDKITEETKSLCEICGLIFAKSYYSTHIRKHSDAKPYVCNTCGDGFKSADYLKNHQQRHVKTPRSCPYCGKIFFWWTTYARHVNKHASPLAAPLKCTLCYLKYNHQILYDEHIKKSHQKFECYVCQKKYQQLKYLKIHVESHYYKSNIQLRQKVPTVRYPCEYCGKSFLSELTMRMHTKNHTSNRIFKCDICNESIIGTEKDETEHKFQHSIGKTIYDCDMCSEEFISQKDYVKHLRVHYQQTVSDTEPKLENVNFDKNKFIPASPIIDPTEPYELSLEQPLLQCDDKSIDSKITVVSGDSRNKKYSTDLPNLSNNSNIDSKSFLHVRSNFCKPCNVSFTKLVQYQQHNTLVHRKAYRCKICKTLINDIESHKRLHPVCKICKLVCSTEEKLKSHMLMNHQIKIMVPVITKQTNLH